MKKMFGKSKRVLIAFLVFIFSISLLTPVSPVFADVGMAIRTPLNGLENLYYGNVSGGSSGYSLINLQNLGVDMFKVSLNGSVTAAGDICGNGKCLSTSGGQWTTSGSNIYYNGGNVGIGTTNPSQKLDVNGNINVSNGYSYTYNGSSVITANTVLESYYFGPAGNSSSSGGSSTGVGRRALNSNTTGNNNTAVGHSALAANTTGDGNTAEGVTALYRNTTGSYNTAAGLQSLYTNVSGGNNTAQGFNALVSNTASFNTAQGSNALAANTTGTYGTAVGYSALSSNTTGSYNTSIGYYAGYNTSPQLQTMSNCTFVGTNANSSANGITNSTAIGNGAQVTASNQVAIGNSSVSQTLLNGNISIGTTGTVGKLNVNGSIIFYSGGLFANNMNLSIGAISGGTHDVVFYTDATAEKMRLLGNGNLGIGTATPGYKLTVNGEPAANGYTAFTNYSDSRLKKNINYLGDGYLAKVLALKPSTFNYNSLTGYDQKTLDRTVTGFIAQDVQKVFPDMVGKTTINGSEYLDTNLSALPIYIVKAIQEQQKEIESKQKQLDDQQKEIDILKEAIRNLQK